jgi:hypothetical protein
MTMETAGTKSMGTAVEWETSLETALTRARSERKPVLVDFFNPG